jgi:hypothetical protein
MTLGSSKAEAGGMCLGQCLQLFMMSAEDPQLLVARTSHVCFFVSDTTVDVTNVLLLPALWCDHLVPLSLGSAVLLWQGRSTSRVVQLHPFADCVVCPALAQALSDALASIDLRKKFVKGYLRAATCYIKMGQLKLAGKVLDRVSGGGISSSSRCCGVVLVLLAAEASPKSALGHSSWRVLVLCRATGACHDVCVS